MDDYFLFSLHDIFMEYFSFQSENMEIDSPLNPTRSPKKNKTTPVLRIPQSHYLRSVFCFNYFTFTL